MSHFLVGVICTPDELKTTDLKTLINLKLAPFDESIVVPQYVYATKEQLIEQSKQEIAVYEQTYYAAYLKDKDAYVKDSKMPEHIHYLEEIFPLKLKWTDEQHYQDVIRFYEPEEIGPNGEVYSTYNPKAKWDWYTIGGRWEHCLPTKSGSANYAPLKDIIFKKPISEEDRKRMANEHRVYTTPLEFLSSEEDKDIKETQYYSDAYYLEHYPTLESYIEDQITFTTYALLTSDGTWYDKKGEDCLGYKLWKPEAERKLKQVYLDVIEKENPDSLFVLVDCHI